MATIPRVRDHRVAQAAGVACVVIGAWLLYDAYDRRGRRRPFALKLLPGA